MNCQQIIEKASDEIKNVPQWIRNIVIPKEEPAGKEMYQLDAVLSEFVDGTALDKNTLLFCVAALCRSGKSYDEALHILEILPANKSLNADPERRGDI